MSPDLALDHPRAELRRRLRAAEAVLDTRRAAARRGRPPQASQLSLADRREREERNLQLVLLANWRIM